MTLVLLLGEGDAEVTPPPPDTAPVSTAPEHVDPIRDSDSFWQELYDGLAPFQYAEGETQAALQRLVKAFAEPFELIHYLVRDDRVTEDVGWTSLLDPLRAPDELLPWLQQMVGAGHINGETNSALRQRILDADAFKRGTLASIYNEAARAGCTHFIVVERYSGSAYQVQLLFENTEYSDARLKRIQSKIPAGIVVSIDFFNAVDYEDLVETYGSYAAAEAANDDYIDLRGG
jgi:hypothetical protein